jgi:hypothetical protein
MEIGRVGSCERVDELSGSVQSGELLAASVLRTEPSGRAVGRAGMLPSVWPSTRWRPGRSVRL